MEYSGKTGIAGYGFLLTGLDFGCQNLRPAGQAGDCGRPALGGLPSSICWVPSRYLQRIARTPRLGNEPALEPFLNRHGADPYGIARLHGAPHYCVVPTSETGILPPSYNGMEGILTGVVGGIYAGG
jgi:hypothetical protein